jgi:hypothetical protein
MNRRTFIKTAVAGGAALWLPQYAIPAPLTIISGRSSLVVYQATLTSPRISSVAGAAFLDNLPAAITDLVTAYGDSKLSIELYSSGLMLKGVMASIGTGETLTEQITAEDDRTLASDTGWWVKQDGTVTIGSGTCNFASSNNVALYKVGVLTAAALKLYKTVFTITSISSGGVRIYLDGIAMLTNRTTAATFTEYVTVPASGGSGNINFRGENPATASIDNLSVGQVTAPSTSGVILESARGAGDGTVTTNQWGTANYNQTTYTAIVRLLR